MKLSLFVIIFLLSINSYSQCNKGFTVFAGIGSSFSNSLKENYNPLLNFNLSVGFVTCKTSMIRVDYQYINFKSKGNSNTLSSAIKATWVILINCNNCSN